MLGEAVDEGGDACSAGEDGAPLLVREVGGDDRGPLLVPTADDRVQQVGGAAVAGEVAELVQDQQVDGGVAPQPPLERGEGFLA